MRHTLISVVILFGVLSLAAEELETRSGERLRGRVVSLDEAKVVFQSETMGKMTIARSNVASLVLSPSPAITSTNQKSIAGSTPAGGSIKSNADLQAALRNLPSTNDLVGAVARDYLSQATPEATGKFNDMVTGLLTGRMSMNDLRVQAKAVADQTRSMRAELGEEGGSMLDSYLAILDKFIQEGATQPAVKPTKPAPQSQPLKQPAPETGSK